jgi:hypothetical protein
LSPYEGPFDRLHITADPGEGILRPNDLTANREAGGFERVLKLALPGNQGGSHQTSRLEGPRSVSEWVLGFRVPFGLACRWPKPSKSQSSATAAFFRACRTPKSHCGRPLPSVRTKTPLSAFALSAAAFAR